MSFSWTIPPATVIASPVPTDAGTSDLLGYDILFTKGDLQKSNGDYIRVGGLDNLRLAIYRRLITKPGEFRFRPTYGAGVGTFVKKAMTQANIDTLRSRVIEQLLQDRRINEVEVQVEQVTVNGQPVVKISVRATAFGNKTTFQPFTFAQEAA